MASQVMRNDKPAYPDAETADEAALLLRSRQGDTRAFGGLVRRYQDRLFNACLRICGDAGRAEDAAQEAFLRAFTSLAGFDGRSAFYTWLFRIAMNLAISERRKTRRSGGSLESMVESGGLRLASGERPPGEEAAIREEHGLVLQALEELDEAHRAVVVLRDIECLDYARIAEILGIAPGTVKSRLHRARMALRERLQIVMGRSRDAGEAD